MNFSRSLEVINLAAALDRVGGDRELLQEVAQLFLETSPVVLSQIREAVGLRDARSLEHAAHTLKGSVANFAAETVFQAAFRLEQLGRAGGDLTGVEDAYAALEAEMQRLRPALVALGGQP